MAPGKVPGKVPASSEELLSVLHEQGGIYLDMDVLCLRSFEPLRRHEIVLGEEGKDRGYGLCNAVILAAPGSWFVRKWLAGYDPDTSLWKGFRSTGRDAYWNELSVRYPAYLARLYPGRVHVVDHRAFFWPTWWTRRSEVEPANAEKLIHPQPQIQ